METNSALSLEPRIARINTDEEGLAGTLGAQSGRVLTSASASKLADGLAKPPLHSLRK